MEPSAWVQVTVAMCSAYIDRLGSMPLFITLCRSTQCVARTRVRPGLKGCIFLTLKAKDMICPNRILGTNFKYVGQNSNICNIMIRMSPPLS